MKRTPRQLTIKENDRFHTIGEVSDMLDVKTHVLYFWEKEFPRIRPPRGRNKRRRYQQQQIDAIKEVKRLLWDELYTIKGAQKRMNDASEGAERPRNTAETRKLIDQIDAGINKALDMLDTDKN